MQISFLIKVVRMTSVHANQTETRHGGNS